MGLRVRRFGVGLASAVCLMASVAMARDCNRNGIDDRCDISCHAPGCNSPPGCGLSVDNSPGNGIPDECEGEQSTGQFSTNADFESGKSINLNSADPGQLSRNELPKPLPFIWVAATGRHTVVKLFTGSDNPNDPNPGTVLGEYLTRPNGMSGLPSRLAIDQDGNAWIGNMDEGLDPVPDSPGSVVKIGQVIGGTDLTDACFDDDRKMMAPPYEYNTCVDRDGDGLITTSNYFVPLAWDNAGGVDSDGGVSTAVDECILDYIRTDASGVHFVAVDRDNMVWVGGHFSGDNTFVRLDSATGEEIDEFDLRCGGMHGLIDGNGVIWASSGSPHSPRLFQHHPMTPVADCCINVLADINNDGVISSLDETIEDSNALELTANLDDDNFNLIPDNQELAVAGEDDLQRIEIDGYCNLIASPGPTWSVSWPAGPAPELQIWRTPDKSDAEESPILNGLQYPLPLPASLWIEAIGTLPVLPLVFVVQTHSPLASSDISDSISVDCHCSFQYRYCGIRTRDYLHPQINGFIGAKGTITLNNPPLCGEPHSTEESHSNAYVSVNIDPQTPNAIWGQLGYDKHRLEGETSAYFVRYVEVQSGPNDELDYVLEFLDSPESIDQYEAVLHPVLGAWRFEFGDLDDVVWIVHPTWVDRTCNHIGWDGETTHIETHLIGTPLQPVHFSDLEFLTDEDMWETVDVNNQLVFPRRNDAPTTFSFQPISSTEFSIWDDR